jgi:hypothetical protein
MYMAPYKWNRWSPYRAVGGEGYLKLKIEGIQGRRHMEKIILDVEEGRGVSVERGVERTRY